jgi:fumarate hydratase class II
MDQQFRLEKDSMGEMRVAGDAYYGAQTARRWRIFRFRSFASGGDSLPPWG